MKNHLLTRWLIVIIACLPNLSFAQWNMVRFDEFNYFTNVETADPDNALASGLLSTGTASFLMRTNDGGITWDSIPINNSGNNYLIYKLHFVNIDDVFAGGAENNQQMMLKSNDNGTTWTEITPNTSSVKPIIAISFMNPLQGYAADETSIYFTNDGGNTWTSVSLGFNLTDFSFNNLSTGYAVGSMGLNAVVMKSDDGGQTWNNVLSVPNGTFGIYTMSLTDVLSNDIAFSAGKYSNVLFRTINGGASWDTIINNQIFDIQDFDFRSATSGHVLSTMGEIYSTDDGGNTWVLEYATAGGVYGPGVYLTSIAFTGNTGYVCGSSGLIKKYEPGTTGLETVNESKQISIYPNPIYEPATLNIKGFDGKYLLQVFNQAGQMVLHQIHSDNHNTIDLDLSPGVYSLHIQTEQRFVQKKLVVLK